MDDMKIKDSVPLTEEPMDGNDRLNETIMDRPIEEDDDDDEPSVVTTSRAVLNSLDTYIVKHDKNMIVRELNECLMNGTLSELTGVPVSRDSIIRSGDVVLTNFAFWILNSSDVLADIICKVTIQEQTLSLYISLWYNTDEAFDCEIREIGSASDIPDRAYMKMDKYGVPIMTNDDIEMRADQMWEHYDQNALLFPEARNPRNLMDHMHLECVSHWMYEAKNIHSSLFFEEGTLLVRNFHPEDSRKPKPIEVTIPARTVVLNTGWSSYDGRLLDQYHECYHYENHSIFFRIQKMIQTDISKVKYVEVTASKNRVPADVLKIMEYQANRGAYALMLPRSVVRAEVTKKVQEIYSQSQTTKEYINAGIVFESIIGYLSAKYFIPEWRVKTRLIQLGYIAAKGAHNYVDGYFIEPFAFSDSKSSDINDTYVIDSASLAKLYFNDKRLYKLMHSGDYVFVDGHVCVNNPQYIKITDSGCRLTLWARAHVDDCCLRFTRIYETEGSSGFKFGRLNCDEAYKKHYRGYLDPSGTLTDEEYRATKKALTDAILPMDFAETLKTLMSGEYTDHRCTVEALAYYSHVSESTIKRLRKSGKSTYKRDQIVAICFTLHLPGWISDLLLEKAGLEIKRYGDLGYLGELLDCHFMDSVDEIQRLLERNNLPKLELCD